MTQSAASASTSRAAGTKSRESPQQRANFLSILFFSWLDPLIKAGYKKELEISDLYNVSEENSSEYLCHQLEKEWKKEAAKVSVSKKPSYYRALLLCFKWQIMFFGIFALIEEAARVAQPLLLACILEYFTHSEVLSNSAAEREPTDGGIDPTVRAYLFAAGLAVASAITAITHHPLYFYSFVTGMKMKIASCALIYRKALRLNHKSIATTTTGHIVNLMSTDVSRMEYGVIFIHYLWLAPLQAAVVLAILWMHIGAASLAGYALVLLLTPIQALLGRIYAKLRLRTAVQSDERIRLMDQVVAGMKVIKMYCWEKPFAQLIAAVRAREMRVIGTGARIRMLSMELGYFSFSKIATAACVLAYVLIHHRVPPLETVLVLMRLLGTIQDSLAYNMTRAMSIWGEISSTCARIQHFLLMDEIEYGESQLPRKIDEQASVEFCSFSGKWEGGSGAPVLNDVTARVTSGELLAVVGPVGAGKSSLLAAALGELPPASGRAVVRGRVAYAAQQPWVFSASLRQNILFGVEFDAQKYAAVIEACALKQDIESLVHGDETLVGERGVILSGGQRARVGLARAVYQDADVYLLDDPLSAVDAAVAKHLFDKCINGILRDRVRVLVTHQLHFLRAAGNVLVLVDGEVKATGTYSDLVNSGLDFVEVLKHDVQAAAERIENAPSSPGSPGSPTSMPPTFLQPPQPLRSLSSSDAEAAIGSSVPDLLGPTALYLSASHMLACDDDGLSGEMKNGGHRSRSASPQGRRSEEAERRSGTRYPIAITGLPRSADEVATSAEEPLLARALNAKDVGDAFADREGIEPEHVEKGTVAIGTYWMFFRSGGHPIVLAFLFLLIAAGQASFMTIDWFLSKWAHTEDAFQASLINQNRSMMLNKRWNDSVTPTAAVDDSSVAAHVNISLSSDTGGTLVLDKNYDEDMRMFMTKIYAVLISVLVVLSSMRTLAFYQMCLNASKKIHDRLFSTVVRTPMRFFDTNPVGRILNRFSKDTGTIDDQLPLNFFDFFACSMLLSGTVILAAIINPWVLVPLVPIVVILVIIYRLYTSTSRAIKRLEGVTRSPMFSHLSSTLSGLYTIRALKAQPSFIEEFDTFQDGHTEAFYLFLCVARWLAIRLDWMCVVFVTSVTFLCMIAKDNLDLSPDLFGLTITYVMALMGMFQWVVRQSTEIESMMTSVERVAEYMRLQPEAPLETKCKPPLGWPHLGCIDADDVSLRYAAGEPLVLKSLNFRINAAEKVGICGRTGAGKSSILAMLFRLCEPSGRVSIDGISISDIGLHDLRSKISIIPQDPVLFSTSVRGNLDPFSEHADEALWAVLQQVQLAATVQDLPGGLDAPIAEGGSNFSVGQRQLLCLARAMLRRNRILVVDEATANVDPKTDATIQETIRNKFSDCTVLTIAHRLNTIMDSDRVMVLEQGSLREFGEPHTLLQQPDSLFRGLVKHTGKGFDGLCAAAKAAYDRRKASAADGTP